jgi:galactokinase
MTGPGPLVGDFRRLFGRDPEIVARAPGRIEVIGNHTDYNGGTVLGAAIDRSVWVALARRADGIRRMSSGLSGRVVERPASDLARLSGPDSWVNYPLGVLAALPSFGLRSPAGFDYLASSDLPVGAGLSSSAAIELASGLAFLRAAGEDPPREMLVRIGRHAENNFVGVPCGILDQGVSGFGRKDRLVFIDCRGPRFDTVPLPPGAHFWIFNTHTKHALVDGMYAQRHRECQEAARALGVALLADVKPPVPGTLPEPQGRRARHVVEEIARVGEAVRALEAGDLLAVGRLLTASHRSSRDLFENSTAELDFLVDTLVALPGVYGARLTGGGFGGAVMAMTDGGFNDARAAEAAASYARRFGSKPGILHARTANGAELL